MIGIRRGKYFPKRKGKRHLRFNLLCFQKMQMVNRPSASFHSTFFNDIPYQFFGNAVERCRKRRKPSKGYISSPDHGKTALTFTFDKKVHISHIRGPPGHVERNDSLQHDQEAFFVRKMSISIEPSLLEKIFSIFFLKRQGFCLFNIYHRLWERRCEQVAC